MDAERTRQLRLRTRKGRAELLTDVAWWYSNRYRVIGAVAVLTMVVVMVCYHMMRSRNVSQKIQDLKLQRDQRRQEFEQKKEEILTKNKEELAALEAKLNAHLEEQREKFQSQTSGLEQEKKLHEDNADRAKQSVEQKKGQVRKLEQQNQKMSQDMRRLTELAREDIREIEAELQRYRKEEARLEAKLAQQSGKQSVAHASSQEHGIIQHALDEFSLDQQKLQGKLHQIREAARQGRDASADKNEAKRHFDKMMGLHEALRGLQTADPELAKQFASQITPALRSAERVKAEYDAMLANAYTV